MERCSSCKSMKSLDAFYKKKNGELYKKCIRCTDNNRQYRKTHHEELKERNREYQKEKREIEQPIRDSKREERYAKAAKEYKLDWGSVYEKGNCYVYKYTIDGVIEREKFKFEDDTSKRVALNYANTRKRLMSLEIAKKKYGDIACESCREGMSPYSLERHVKSAKHLNNVKKKETSPTP